MPPGDHYCIETVALSGVCYGIDIVAPSSDHYGTTKVAPPSDHSHTKFGGGHGPGGPPSGYAPACDGDGHRRDPIRFLIFVLESYPTPALLEVVPTPSRP